jgi:hypothetical protein
MEYDVAVHDAKEKSNNLTFLLFSWIRQKAPVDGQLDAGCLVLELAVLCTTNCSHGHGHGT